MKDWTTGDETAYAVKRSVKWDAGLPKPHDSEVGASALYSRRIFSADTDHVKHTQIKTTSMMRAPLWDAAQWIGVVFESPVGSSPPTLSLAFRNGEASAKIFSHWEEELGREDTHDKLLILILRGVERTNPFAYRVWIGSNPLVETRGSEAKRLIFTSRVHTMHPTSSANLDRFVKEFDIFKTFGLGYSVFSEDVAAPHYMYDRPILKHHIEIRDAWQVGPDEVASIAIYGDEDPLVPAGVENAPISELLSLRKQAIEKRNGREP